MWLSAEQFDIADMFGRSRRPVLSLRLLAERDGGSLLVVVQNCGRGLARSPYLDLELPTSYCVSAYGADGNGRFGLRPLGQHDARYSFGGDAGTVIHVGQELIVAWLEARVTAFGLGGIHVEIPGCRIVDARIKVSDPRRAAVAATAPLEAPAASQR